MTRALGAAALLLALGCGSAPPPLPSGKGGLAVRARAVRDAGVARAVDPYERDHRYQAEAAEYDNAEFDDLVVTVEGDGVLPEGGVVSVILRADGFASPVLAAGRGDVVRFENQTTRAVVLYGVNAIAGEEFADWPELAPGRTLDWPAAGSAGPVHLYVAGDEKAHAILFLAPGGRAAVLRSGTSCTFLDLAPGPYAVSGWHATLPCGRRDVTVVPGEYAEVEVVFSVDALSE